MRLFLWVALIAASAGCAGSSASSASSCSRTDDRVELAVLDATSGHTTCATLDPTSHDGGAPISWSFVGTVTAVDPGSLAIDTCSPHATCAPTVVTVRLKAAGLALSVPVGTVVRVQYAGGATVAGYACVDEIAVTSAAWPPDPDPTPLLYVAASDGAIGSAATDLFAVESVRQDCSSGGSGCGGEPPGEYALAFSSNAAPDKPSVRMGETVTWQLDAANRVHARNLRSFQTTACDDYWNWAWWVAR